MLKPADWNTTQANDGSFERVTPGGHICLIKGAKLDHTKSGKELFVLYLEVAEGSQLDGIFQRDWERKRSQNATAEWPVAGQYRQLTQDNSGGTNPYFKGLIKAIEDSNGFTWNFDENTLRGKKIGIIFREEEFMANDGNIKTSVKPAWARSVATIQHGVDIPKIKRLQTSSPSMAAAGFTPANEEELPF